MLIRMTTFAHARPIRNQYPLISEFCMPIHYMPAVSFQHVIHIGWYARPINRNSHPLICRVNRLLHCWFPLLTTRSQNQTHQVLKCNIVYSFRTSQTIRIIWTDWKKIFKTFAEEILRFLYYTAPYYRTCKSPGLQRSSIHEKTQPESSAKLFIETCWLNDWNSESMNTWNTWNFCHQHIFQ